MLLQNDIQQKKGNRIAYIISFVLLVIIIVFIALT